MKLLNWWFEYCHFNKYFILYNVFIRLLIILDLSRTKWCLKIYVKLSLIVSNTLT